MNTDVYTVKNMDVYNISMPIRPPPTNTSPIVRMLQAEAKRQRFTDYALAKASGLSIPTITRAFSGRVSPTLATVEVIAAALGLVVKVERGEAIGLEPKPLR